MEKAIEALKCFPSKTVGQRETMRLVSEKKAKIVILAADADKHIIEKVSNLCRECCVEICFAGSKSELGKLCGITVACAVVGLY